MNKERVGRIIGGSFGVVFVQISAGKLPTAVGGPLRLLAIAAFVGMLVVKRRGATARPAEDAAPAPAPAAPAPRVGFGRRYWYVVAAEAVALLGGLVLINPVLHAPQVTVGWIAFVVGVHFFGLATAWQLPSLRTLGAAMAACGLGGMVLACFGAPAAVIAVVAGIAPGALLLAWTWRPGAAAPAAVR
ncbi:hypothetical protein AB0F11_34605 [Streptomyces sp. NPDC032472]|uniref:hypothetical protein n=1 Tax=Streptomyces sp. NPDC032472 TaxID=3155018 RepID=UPI0033D11031